MTIDFWGLGLQAVNVLILIWLLSRVFWRPVAMAIANRQESAHLVIEAAKETQAKADSALEEVTSTRAGFSAERTAILEAARAEAESKSKTTIGNAQVEAEKMLTTAKNKIEENAEATRKANGEQASDLSLVIAARLLERLKGPATQSAFLSQLTEAIAKLSPTDLALLVDEPKGIKIVTTTDTEHSRDEIVNAVQKALGGTPDLRFVIDPDLIAGIELHASHFVLHNSWQADLDQVKKAVKSAA